MRVCYNKITESVRLTGEEPFANDKGNLNKPEKNRREKIIVAQQNITADELCGT